MSVTEPATLDNHGARWSTAGEYIMVDGAKRYESSEISFAGKVGSLCDCLDPTMPYSHNLRTGTWLDASWMRCQACCSVAMECVVSCTGIYIGLLVTVTRK